MRLFTPLTVFVVSLCALVAMIAGSVGFYLAFTSSPPTGLVKRAVSVGETFLETGIPAPGNLFSRRGADAPEDDFHQADADAAPRGWRAFMAYNLERDIYVVDLFDPDGAKVWTWPVADPAIEGTGGDGDRIHPHGLVVLKDGSIVINGVAESRILARYGRCGAPKWMVRDYYHHLMTPDTDAGGIWSWYGEGSSYTQDQIMVRFDPENGRELERISIIEDVIWPHPENRAMLGLPDYFHKGAAREHENRRRDLFHTNDVEPLTAALAPRFPGFEAGDLLVSLRNLNMVAVIDRKTKRIKWRAQGPWIQQHDPDFTADGRISLFNNNFLGPYERRSGILTVDPVTGAVATMFDASPFYSARMGSHQMLANGIVHVTIPHEGRAIEVDTRADKVVFEYNNRALEGHNGHLANSVWLPEDYFDENPASYACPG
jgi:hypothetical protein